MDRVELRTKFAGRIEKFRLAEFDVDVYIRRLSGRARAKLGDKHKLLATDTGANAFEKGVIEVQCRVVAQGLVNEMGSPIYSEDEIDAIADEFPATALDELSKKILEISGLGKSVEDAIKNSVPTPNGNSNSDLQPVSEGGTLTIS